VRAKVHDVAGPLLDDVHILDLAQQLVVRHGQVKARGHWYVWESGKVVRRDEVPRLGADELKGQRLDGRAVHLRRENLLLEVGREEAVLAVVAELGNI